MTIPTSSNPSVNPFDLAVPVSDRVQIKRMILTETRASRADEDRFKVGKFGLKYHHVVANVNLDRERAEVAVKVSFTVITVEDIDPELEPAVSIEATFVLIYSLDSIEGIENDNLAAFGVTNAVYNAWPYWREFVQSTAVRMGLPALVVPVFRFSKPKAAESTTPKDGSVTEDSSTSSQAEP